MCQRAITIIEHLRQNIEVDTILTTFSTSNDQICHIKTDLRFTCTLTQYDKTTFYVTISQIKLPSYG